MAMVQPDAKLWMGELDPNMDDNYLTQLWASAGYIVNARVIRDKTTQQSQGYGFVTFQSLQHAQAAVASMNGQPIPGVPGKVFKLNWAHNSAMSSQANAAQQYPPDAPTTGDEYSVFVGDLSREVSDEILYTTFQSRYPSTKNAKVVIDPDTGFTKGYGFVRFTNHDEGRRAIDEMQAVYVGGRAIRLNEATKRNSSGGGSSGGSSSSSSGMPDGYQPENDPNNTTVFVGNIEGLHENDLRMAFSPFGQVVQVRIPGARTCGFVVFQEKWPAAQAIATMNGQWIGHAQVRCAWGKQSGQAQRTPAPTGMMNPYGGGAPMPQTPYGQPGYPQPSYGGGMPPTMGAPQPMQPYGAGPSSSLPVIPEEKSEFEDMTKPLNVEAANEEFVAKQLKSGAGVLETVGWPVHIPGVETCEVLEVERDGPSSVLR